MDESVRSEAKDFIMWERTWMNKDRLMDELVEKAKKAVVRAWEGRETTERRWHTISFVPYGNMREQRLEIHILVGTPVKGFVVANYGLGVVTAYDWNQKQLCRYSFMQEALKRSAKRTDSSSSPSSASEAEAGREEAGAEAREMIKRARSILEGY